MRNRNNRVLITGGAAGIGAAIAVSCRSRGYEVVILDQKNADCCVDLSNVEETAQALQQILQQGPITRLVNNVGMVAPAAIEAQSLAQFDQVMALNIRCALQCSQALIPGMKQQQFGRIVNMSSRAALGKTFRAAYAASKAALIGLTRVSALELDEFGITVNAIGPGPIETALFKQANPIDAPHTQQILNSVPVKRFGQPEDVAHACDFFLDEQSGFITGQVLYVCGGMTIGVNGI